MNELLCQYDVYGLTYSIYSINGSYFVYEGDKLAQRDLTLKQAFEYMAKLVTDLGQALAEAHDRIWNMIE